jgi:2-iminobutanoate/2-iminopropanoate deaminase
MRTVVTTSAAPAPIGPYSQAIEAGGWLFVSGQTPLDPSSGQIVPGGIAEQTERALQNIAAILSAAGSSPDRIVRCVVYLKSMADFDAMNAVYGAFFAGSPPARTTIQAAALPRDALVEIEATAMARQANVSATSGSPGDP